ncbi:MAG: hypothetical protein ING29_15105, partial [Azospirillum sp.]|nr:hypothetical protein [Azospirillum sp.]
MRSASSPSNPRWRIAVGQSADPARAEPTRGSSSTRPRHLFLFISWRAAHRAVRLFLSLPNESNPRLARLTQPRPRRKLAHIMFAFVDIEASGLVNGFPIEIGWAREDGHVGALLIRPHSEWLSDLAWDPNAEYLHGLPRDLLLARGTPIDDTVDQLNVALRGCRCISDSPSNDWRWLFLLLEFYDRGERQFTFDLLADPAEPLILGIAESVCRSHEFVDDVLRSTSAHRAHTAAGDAATWAAALDAIKKSGNIELILPTWREHARNAMPWRSSKTADVAEIAEEQLAKFDDALRELANG